MDYTVATTNEFLSHYNEIDKLFTAILELDKYIPFHEKIHAISAGDYPIRRCVQKHQQKLRYFGDLRNQIVHGFHQDHHHYVLVSEYACQQIKVLVDELHTPKSPHKMFHKTIHIGEPWITIGEALRVWEKHPHTLLVLRTSGGGMTGVVTPQMVTDIMAHMRKDMDAATTRSMIQEQMIWEKVGAYSLEPQVAYLPLTTTLYDIEHQLLHADAPDILLLTPTGMRWEKPECAIRRQDLPKLAPYVQL